MTGDVPLSASEIRSYLFEVGEELRVGEGRHVVVVVGGALLALRHLRDSTSDIDSARRIDDELRVAVEEVGRRHGLAPKWLNDSAAPFLPATFSEADCEVLLAHDRLWVLGAPLEQVFLMKLYGARTRDIDDLVIMWPKCRFESPDQVAVFFAEAYPHAPDDEFLSQFVGHIAALASGSAAYERGS